MVNLGRLEYRSGAGRSVAQILALIYPAGNGGNCAQGIPRKRVAKVINISTQLQTKSPIVVGNITGSASFRQEYSREAIIVCSIVGDQSSIHEDPIEAVELRVVVSRHTGGESLAGEQTDSFPAVAADVHVLNQIGIASEEDAIVAHSLNRAVADSDVEVGKCM
jgi:hypothetical protein